MAGRQLGALLDGFLKQPKRVVKLLLLQSLHALKDQQFCLRQVRAKFLQAFQILQFFLCWLGFRPCARKAMLRL